MNNLELAKKELLDGKYTLVIVKDNKVILRSEDRGIKPLYDIVKSSKLDYKDSFVADKVVGKGAAILYDLIGIKRLYAGVMSDTAIEFLEGKDIEYFYDVRTATIKNRTETDLCPIEKLSLESVNGMDFIGILDNFFDRL